MRFPYLAFTRSSLLACLLITACSAAAAPGPQPSVAQFADSAQELRADENDAKLLAAAHNRIPGYQGFLFGMTRHMMKKRLGDCMRDSRDWQVSLRKGDYYSLAIESGVCLAGDGTKKRFSLGMDSNGTLARIAVPVGEFNPTQAHRIVESISQDYATVYQPSDDEAMWFDQKKIRYVVISAFDDWSIVYQAEWVGYEGQFHAVTYVVYLSDEAARVYKAEYQKMLPKSTTAAVPPGAFRAAPSGGVPPKTPMPKTPEAASQLQADYSNFVLGIPASGDDDMDRHAAALLASPKTKADWAFLAKMDASLAAASGSIDCGVDVVDCAEMRRLYSAERLIIKQGIHPPADAGFELKLLSVNPAVFGGSAQ